MDDSNNLAVTRFTMIVSTVVTVIMTIVFLITNMAMNLESPLWLYGLTFIITLALFTAVTAFSFIYELYIDFVSKL